MDFLKWLFNDSNGHFAILLFLLLGACGAYAFQIPNSIGAINALWPLVLLKVRP